MELIAVMTGFCVQGAGVFQMGDARKSSAARGSPWRKKFQGPGRWQEEKGEGTEPGDGLQ
jgi:hypothetical protein